jgi:hypothetical protein
MQNQRILKGLLVAENYFADFLLYWVLTIQCLLTVRP